ncbi:MAG: hypothetical protein HYX38_13000 [Rhodospirillales bacterium]|nr:hypothetical protein [Rhodospirillales bacterium]
MPVSRAIVWMDSGQASVFRFGADDLAQDRLRADSPFLKVDHKAGRMHAGRLAADLDFLDRVIDSLRGTRAWCLVGPDGTKDELVGYLDRYKDRDGHIAGLRAQLHCISPMDRPTGDGLVLQARQAAEAPRS